MVPTVPTVPTVILATLVLCVPRADSAQTLSVLHIRVVLADPEGKPSPVPRHALLISDNPATAAPRLITTTLDGTADVKLRPGNYTLESDRPVVFNGKAYQWTQVVEILAGRDATLELTAANAEVLSPSSTTTASGTPLEADPSFVLPRWQDSVVALWTPFTRASAFVIDSRGLLATNGRVIGTASSVEVQLSPSAKVSGTVLAADRIRDVAVLWVDPKAVASIRPLPLACGNPPSAPASGQEIFTIGVPLREPKDVMAGKVTRVEPGAVLADFMLDSAGAGGPVFAAVGSLVGITSLIGEEDENRRGDVKIVPVANACEVIGSAEKKMGGNSPPAGTLLPVDPARTFPVDALKAIVEKRAGSLAPYQVSSADFDLAFITPVQTYGAEYQQEQARERDRKNPSRRPESQQQVLVSRLMDFGNWASYVEDFPPVLLVRVTPKMTEGFWTKVGRGAAATQGMSIPPLKGFKYSFSRLRAFCDETEVTPIHPFKIELRLSGTNTFYEGLYVFDPVALGPRCGTVRLVMYSDKAPEKGDAKVIDPKLVRQIWEDFGPYRETGL